MSGVVDSSDDEPIHREVERREEIEEPGSEDPGTPGRGAESGSGDDALDSSEEESDDNPEEERRVREGFIVSDEDDEGDEDDSEDTSAEKRRRRRKRSHREPELEEDDLELVREAAGRGTRFKRLKKAGGGDEHSGLSAMFDDERDDRPRGDQMDDFIEEDEFSDDEALRRQEERETATRRRQDVSGRAKLGFASELSGLDEDKIGEIYEVFGDGELYDWALEGEDEADNAVGVTGAEGDDDEAPESDVRKLDLKDVFEPAELQKRMLTAKDNVIRAEDVPERLQELRSPLRHGTELTPVEQYELKAAVADAIFESKRALLVAEPELRDVLRQSIHRVVEYVCVDNLEVPFVWHHRQDYLVAWQGDVKQQLLTRDDLWSIVDAAQDWYALREKRQSVRELWGVLESQAGSREKALFSAVDAEAQALVEWQDAADWLQFQYSAALRTERRHARFGVYERFRESPDYAKVLDLHLDEVPAKLDSEANSGNTNDEEEPEMEPGVLDMAAQELATDPRVRRWFRVAFEAEARVDVRLTEDGRARIAAGSPFADIKYARNWAPAELRLRPDVFLRMVRAEEQGLVVVRIQYPDYKSTLYERFRAAIGSRSIAKEASRRVVPLVCRTVGERLRQTCERALAAQVRAAMASRLDQAPYKPPGYVFGTVPRVLAVSAGVGGPTDAVLGAFVDEEGRLVEHAKLGDPRDPTFRATFVEMVRRCEPDIVGVAGMAPTTRRLHDHVADVVADEALVAGESSSPLGVVWVRDDAARLYRGSPRAQRDFPGLVETARYCIGLARYLQSPLLEYAALGMDLLQSVPLHPHQALLGPELFAKTTETAFVDAVNSAGVDINAAARSQYVASLLPYVAGLGPRKASGLLQAVQARGSLNSRSDLVVEELTPRTIFINCAAFLKFPSAANNPATADDEDSADPLDATRIHPEDYELARKIAGDALELDEEDVQAAEASGGVIAQLLANDPDGRKLDELVLEEYAAELETRFHRRKRLQLAEIRSELQDHFRELRQPLQELSDVDVFTMLTGETPESLKTGSVVSAVVRHVTGRQLLLALSSGVDATAESGHISDDRSVPLGAQFSPGQAVQAVVLSVDYKALFATVSTSNSAVHEAVKAASEVAPDAEHWDSGAEHRDIARARARSDQELRQTRVIKHPLFRAFSSRQAEEYLAPLQRGDLVVRPSSRGLDHLVITWKVGEMLYQHVDVQELDKPNDYAVGRVLQIGRWRYADLDELIIMHVQAMARKVDEMTQSDKFQAGTRADVDKWLTAYTNARPNQSAYAFCFDHKRPGYFLLCFKTGAASKVREWHVKVIPNGYELMGNAYPDVASLSNGFKLIWQNMRR